MATQPNFFGQNPTPQPLANNNNIQGVQGGQQSVQSQQSQQPIDPNGIKVTISDDKTPIVVLFGPPSCGKTMILRRLTRYLRKKNYTISPVRTFRSSTDEHYQVMCDTFNESVMNDFAAEGTTVIDFMLLMVYKDGSPICQFLEAPGEHFFKPKDTNANKGFPPYISNIKNNNNRKIWLFIVEPDWEDDADRVGYVERIKQLKRDLKPQDKAIFLFNKIDKTPYVRKRGLVNKRSAINSIAQLYKGIFEPFRNTNPITSWLSKYTCEFVCFSTGDYSAQTDRGNFFTEGPDEYPRDLWVSIQNYIKG